MLDRAVRRARPLLICIAAVSAPVFLISYAYSLFLLIQAIGWLWFLPVLACHVMVWIGAACLVDARQERQTSPEHFR